MNITETDKKYIAGTYARFPVEIVGGKGAIAYDAQGREYIDLGSGIGVNAFGYCDEIWAKAVSEQLTKVQHTSNLYYTEPCAELAKLLCEKTGMKKVFFGNSGAEANECAIKAARKYAAEKKGADCFTIVTLNNSFHGRTLTTLAATGQEHYHELFQPLTFGFKHIEPSLFELEVLAAKSNVAAVMIECIQGEGGVIETNPDFIAELSEYCERNDILLIIDEVQTGNGRTGKLYSYMHYGIKPDIISTAKGIGGGLPLGACLLGEKVENVFGFGDHGSTFGGNPVACAGGVSIMNRLTEDFLQEVSRKGDAVRASLSGAKGVESVSGKGLMIGIKPKKNASDIVKNLIEKGVLCLTAKDKIRLLPPLNIEEKTLMKAVNIIKEECAK